MTSEAELKNFIARKKFHKVYLITGSDCYLVKHYAGVIEKKSVDGNEELNLFRLSENTDMEQIYNSLFQFSFTGDRICVSVSNFDFEGCNISVFKKLCEIVTDAPENNTLVLYYDVLSINPKKSDRYKKLSKAVESAGGIVCEFNHKTESELAKMLSAGAKKRGITLDNQTARYMVSVCSDDLNILINELEKLSFCLGQNAVVTGKDIDRICVRTVEASVYDMSRFILQGREKEALLLLNDLLLMGISPVEIYSLICSAYTDIFRVKSASPAGIKPENLAKTFGYAPNRAFVLTKAARDAARISESQICRISQLLLKSNAEIKSKSGGDAGGSRTELEKLIIRIMKISARG